MRIGAFVEWNGWVNKYLRGEEGKEVKVLEASELAHASSDNIQVTLHYGVVLRYVFVLIQMFELCSHHVSLCNKVYNMFF